MSFDVCGTMITTLIDGHCDGGMRSDLFGMISSNEGVEMRRRIVINALLLDNNRRLVNREMG